MYTHKFINRKFKAFLFYCNKYYKELCFTIKTMINKTYLLLNMSYRFSNNRILIGTAFFPYGGVYNHILSIKRYSTFNISLLPKVKCSSIITKSPKLLDYYRQHFLRFSQNNDLILHSHADEWFIKYCERMQLQGMKWVHTYHLPYFPDRHGDLKDWQISMNEALFKVASKADVKISVSTWEKEYLKEVYNIDTVYVPNAVDVSLCDSINVNSFVEKYKLKDFILFASKIDFVKNPEEFISLAVRLPQYNFVILGSGISTASLNSVVGNLPENLMVIEGYLQHEEVLQVLAACRVFVMTSRIEGLPTALLEAMAMSKAVVASNVEGCSELLNDGKYGYLYTLGNVQDLVEKTIRAYNDISIGEKARERVLMEYDWKVVVPKIDELYRTLITT